MFFLSEFSDSFPLFWTAEIIEQAPESKRKNPRFFGEDIGASVTSFVFTQSLHYFSSFFHFLVVCYSSLYPVGVFRSASLLQQRRIIPNDP